MALFLSPRTAWQVSCLPIEVTATYRRPWHTGLAYLSSSYEPLSQRRTRSFPPIEWLFDQVIMLRRLFRHILVLSCIDVEQGSAP